jgi:uroporphyrin-III C-methyltransferase
VTDIIETPEQTPVAESATISAPMPKSKNHTLSFILIWFFIVAIVAAVCFGGLYMAQHLQDQQQLVDNLRQQVEQQQQTVATQQRVIEENVETALADQQSTVQVGLNDLAQRVDNTAARLLALSSVNRDDWKLAEVQYLLRLADQRILLEKDSQNAIALALSADDVLRDMNQADLLGVRKLLAEETAVLKLAGIVDREGIFLRLAALANQIDAIPFIEPLGVESEILEEEEIPTDETYSQKFDRYINNLLHRLSTYVRVRDHGQAINAVLPPSEQKYLQQNLRLMLEQAQVALLRNEPQIYNESLVKAQNWINQYYSLNAQATAVLEELTSLQAEEITPELTNFSNSSAALAEYIEKQDKMAAARRGVRK